MSSMVLQLVLKRDRSVSATLRRVSRSVTERVTNWVFELQTRRSYSCRQRLHGKSADCKQRRDSPARHQISKVARHSDCSRLHRDGCAVAARERRGRSRLLRPITQGIHQRREAGGDREINKVGALHCALTKPWTNLKGWA